MSTDREVLADLLAAVDAASPEPEGIRPLRVAADRARRHLLLVESPDGDCARRIEDASTAAYAAGQANAVDARPDRGQEHGGAIPSP